MQITKTVVTEIAGIKFWMRIKNIKRLTYEFSLILLTICKNTTEINSKLKGKETKKETKTEEKEEK